MTTQNTISDEIIELIEKELPSWFTRRMAADKLNGLFSYGTLCNYGHRGFGPPVHYMGGKACYVKESFIQWLRDYYSGLAVDYDGFTRRLHNTKRKEKV